jgi:hypothetical protein
MQVGCLRVKAAADWHEPQPPKSLRLRFFETFGALQYV